MTLTASAKLQSWKTALDVYVNTQLGVSFPGALDLEGTEFNTDQVTEWVEPRLIAQERPDALMGRADTAGTRYQGVLLLFHLTVFLRMQSATQPMVRLQVLRDLVAGPFSERTKIPVVDYAGDGVTALGNLVVDRIVLDRETSDPTLVHDLRQWTIGVELTWIEGTTP